MGVPLIAPIVVSLLMMALFAAVCVASTMVWLAWKASKKITAPLRRTQIPRKEPDLMRYPERLRMLESELESAYDAATKQADHLEEKREELLTKPGREGLVTRYEEDQKLLHARAASTSRVLGTVWRTRVVLLLRVHLANAARQRPQLDHLPDPLEVQPAHLGQAADLYGSGAIQVRAFVGVIEDHLRTLPDVGPRPSDHAEVDDDDRAAVEQERAAVASQLERLRERMDELSDSLGYLGDRLRTQHLVEGQRGKLEVTPEAGRLLEQVADAVEQLEQLAAVGDRGMAAVAVDALVDDIGDLERAGLEVDAEAEASREVERLLESFTRSG